MKFVAHSVNEGSCIIRTNFLVARLLSSVPRFVQRREMVGVGWTLWDVLRILVACNEIFCYFNVLCWGVCGI
jgi:hypothetical protein